MGDKSLLEIVKLIDPSYKGLREQEILNQYGESVGWHSTALRQDEIPIGGGTHAERLTARRIAIAECIERGLFETFLKSAEQRTKFCLDEIPTTSGFAAGFEHDSTKIRSICEGVERWAWSQWIDYGYYVAALPTNPQLSQLATTLTKNFSKMSFFRKSLNVEIGETSYELNFNVLLGSTNAGVFAGSRVTGAKDDQWTHAAIEAWRNFNNFQIYEREGLLGSQQSWLSRRVAYFGQNQATAFEQIRLAVAQEWPTLALKVCAGSEPFRGVHIWRTLFCDFMPWHLGPNTRFVY